MSVHKPASSISRRDFLVSGPAAAAVITSSAFGNRYSDNKLKKSEPVKRREKILLDTDIGSDIDDAVCLAYLLANPMCDLLGISIVTGEAELRARLASALCKAAGREIPIALGAETPLLVDQRQKLAPQAAALGDWPHDSGFAPNQAIALMRDLVRANPGQVTLLSIGPLTNIALLFKLDPELPRLLKAFVSMAGKFTDTPSPWGPTEWNAVVDPHATAIACRSNPPLHRFVGLDVTLRVFMKPDEVRTRFESVPLLRPVYDFSKVWFAERDILHFHDPLAAATVFNPGICVYERGDIQVELKDADLLGVTGWETNPQGRHEAAMDVSPEAFFEEYFSVFRV